MGLLQTTKIQRTGSQNGGIIIRRTSKLNTLRNITYYRGEIIGLNVIIRFIGSW